jgi:hypothetical protein
MVVSNDTEFIRSLFEFVKSLFSIKGITVKTYSYYLGNAYVNEPTYCLRISNRRRNGRGESCEGRISVKGTEIDHNTVWEDNKERYIPISLIADLLLFRVSDVKDVREIVFIISSGSGTNGGTEIRKPFSEYADRKISVRVGSANAHVPKPYTKTISKIVQSI